MSGFSRVSISPSLRKTINDIKEIAGKHSDEDVYAMLKDCNMDPNETAQKLLYLDTFHEVKRKRDRRKVSSNSRALEENRRITGMQRRGTRVGNYCSNNFDEGVGGKQLGGRIQNSSSSTTRRDSKSFVPVSHKERNSVPVVAGYSSWRSTAPADGSTSICDESYGHEPSLPVAEGNMRGLTEDDKAGYGNKSKELALRPLNLKQFSMLYPSPTPTSTPTHPSKVARETRNQGCGLKRNSSSSASNPVLETSLNLGNAGPEGVINNEAENQHGSAEISANLLADKRMNGVHDVNSVKAVSGSVDSTNNSQSIEYDGERSWVAKSSPLPSSTGHHIANATATGDAQEDNPLEGPSEQTASEIDVKLDKLHISDGQAVIFPNHLHVPEALRNGLTFGSLDVRVQLNNEESNLKDVSLPVNVEATKEPSPSHQSPPQASGGNDHPNHVQSPAKVMVNLTESKQDVSPGNALTCDQPKQEILQAIGKSLNPLPPSIPNCGSNLVPPVVGSHIVKSDGHELQASSKPGSTPLMPRGISQRSIPVLPPFFPSLRQLYPPNYMPYGPYISQLYMPPQNTQHFLTHGVFPHQPSSGNIYMPPTATATSGVKLFIYKPGNMASSPTHFGVSSCYGSFGTPAPSYTAGTTLPPGANGNSSITRSDLKDKDMYSILKQNEDLQVLSCISGRDISALQAANVYYNLPQGHPVAYPPAQIGHSSFAGIYHPNQSISAPSLVQPGVIGGGVEAMTMTPSYPQPQGHTQSRQQYGQTNWNQKLLNRENI